MKKLGGSQNFFMRNRGVTKKSRDYWVATNFNENFVQWNSPKMHIFRDTHIGGYIFLQHCSSGWGVIKFLIIKWGGSQKYYRDTFGNLWPPHSKESGDPLISFIHQVLKWANIFTSQDILALGLNILSAHYILRAIGLRTQVQCLS